MSLQPSVGQADQLQSAIIYRILIRHPILYSLDFLLKKKKAMSIHIRYIEKYQNKCTVAEQCIMLTYVYPPRGNFI